MSTLREQFNDILDAVQEWQGMDRDEAIAKLEALMAEHAQEVAREEVEFAVLKFAFWKTDLTAEQVRESLPRLIPELFPPKP